MKYHVVDKIYTPALLIVELQKMEEEKGTLVQILVTETSVYAIVYTTE